MCIGTISKYTESELMLVMHKLPATIDHTQALIDHTTKEVMWEAPVTDDSGLGEVCANASRHMGACLSGTDCLRLGGQPSRTI